MKFVYGNAVFSPAFVLRKCDPIRYNMLLTDWLDEQNEQNEQIETDIPDENIITDNYEIEPLYSSFKPAVFLGISDGLYYIKYGVDRNVGRSSDF